MTSKIYDHEAHLESSPSIEIVTSLTSTGKHRNYLLKTTRYLHLFFYEAIIIQICYIIFSGQYAAERTANFCVMPSSIPISSFEIRADRPPRRR